MSLIIGFFTFVLVLNCIFLVFLVLLQLPKKEAGIGVAFGGGATDALFGAGSGNMLTKITKWSAGLFFALCLVLAVMTSRQAKHTNASALSEELANRPKSTPSVNTGLLTNTPSAAPAPEATPVKPTPSSGIGGATPPTATGTPKPSTPSPTPPAKPSTPTPSPTPKPK